MRNLLEKINKINAEDLFHVERDLCFYEKVSLAFLLFAGDKTNAHFILQRILVISPTPNVNSDILISYTKVNENWRIFLVEALAIIKANKVLRKLGLPLSDVRTYFLPHVAETSLHINPILKALYFMCEILTPSVASKIVMDISEALNKGSRNDHLRFYNFEYFEVFLLDWITRGLLNPSDNETANISLLTNYLKLNDMEQIRQILEYPLKNTVNSADRTNSQNVPTSYESDESSFNNIQAKTLENTNCLADITLSDCYTIRKESAGFILIINQQNFHKSKDPELKELLPKSDLPERFGTDVDKERLRKTFSSFGYKPIVKDNLNHIETLSNIREIVKRSIVCDSLIVCILTHGIEGSVYACDSVPTKIDQIEKILTDQSLVGKPKMLIIQACQGGVYQTAVPIDGIVTDSPSNSSTYYADMIKAMSTVPGFVSLRHTKKGTWFIQTFCDKVDKLGDRDHMLEILTEVNSAVGDMRADNNACMTPISSQTLRKKFRLPSRIS